MTIISIKLRTYIDQIAKTSAATVHGGPSGLPQPTRLTLRIASTHGLEGFPRCTPDLSPVPLLRTRGGVKFPLGAAQPRGLERREHGGVSERLEKRAKPGAPGPRSYLNRHAATASVAGVFTRRESLFPLDILHLTSPLQSDLRILASWRSPLSPRTAPGPGDEDAKAGGAAWVVQLAGPPPGKRIKRPDLCSIFCCAR